MTDSVPRPTVSRLTALFQRGKTVHVGDDENGQIFLWMNAMTSVEREECILDGAVAQALERQINGPGTATYDMMRDQLGQVTREQIIDALLLNRGAEFMLAAQDDLHADEKWRGDRMLLIERGDSAIKDGLKLSEEEMERFLALNNEYMTAWKAHAAVRADAARAEYNAQETRELIAAHLAAWTDARALKAQADEYRISQLYYSTRVCNAVQRDEGSFDHAACGDHAALLFPERQIVRRQPDALLNMLIPVADEIDRQGGDALGKR